MGVPFVGGKRDVRAYAAQAKLSIETAARELRYRFLFEQAPLHKAQAVAVGHTADDQVETVLMHFIRGAGLNGLKGMPYRSILAEFDSDIPVVRPLLDSWRADIVGYCASHGLTPHYDPTNESTDFLRNRLRHELIPLLETYNPRFREAAWRAGRTLSMDAALLDKALARYWLDTFLRHGEQYVKLDLTYLAQLGIGIQMHVLRHAAQLLRPAMELGFDALERAAAFIADPAQERIDFVGGLFLLRECNPLRDADFLYVAASETGLPTDQWPQLPADADSLSVAAGCEVDLADGWRLVLSNSASSDVRPPDSWDGVAPFETWLDADGLTDEFVIRIRRDGDRFEPLGMDGHSQKLSDFFVNVKLPARARSRWPLVCAGDEIIWVPGYRPAHRHRLQPSTQSILYLAVKPPS